MTRVLLISDTERVHRIFELLEEKGVLQLQTASTLAQGELELAAAGADFTFVQSRISGFSGEILLRHLDKILPNGAQLVLLAGDAEDTAHAKKHGRRSLDLSLSDDLLERTAAALVTGTAMPAGAAGEAPPAAKSAPAKAKIATPPPAVAEEPERNQELVQPGPSADVPEQEAGKPVAEEPPDASPAQGGDQGEAVPFEEVMRRASATVGSLKPELLEVEDRVDFGKDVPGSEGASGAAGSQAEKEGGEVDPVPVGAFFAGEPLADAMLRAEKKSRRRPYRIIASVLALVSLPLFYYLADRVTAPDSKTASVSKPQHPPKASTAVPPAAVPEAKQPASPATTASPAPAAKPEVKPEAKPVPAAKPEVKPETKPLAKPEGKPDTKPTAKRGVSALPPMLEGTRLDADYGKSHPGWVRYIGKRAEYKLFKEAELYRAMQVMAVGGGTLSNDLFKRVLREFGGGMDRCRVESSTRKGDYVVEQCATTGSAAVTVYRNKSDHKMKALVVYYR